MAAIKTTTRTLDIYLQGNSEDVSFKISLNNPKENITLSQVKEIVDPMLTTGLYTKKGEQLTIVEQVVDKTVETTYNVLE